MVAGKVPNVIGTTEYVYLTLYRLKNLTDEEKHQWFKSWHKIRDNLPHGIKIVTEATSAFGTEYTGFTVYEGPLDNFEELIEILDKDTSNFVEKSWTIIGTRGLSLPIAEFQKILEGRPVD
ncbi:hypothetical protein EU527_03865 [Candidatus Thorarchaeota archaeon]|nr:MAG: hypothetical protein EU527_03865 [Candidatus Thorarchaeota archaeon]